MCNNLWKLIRNPLKLQLLYPFQRVIGWTNHRFQVHWSDVCVTAWIHTHIDVLRSALRTSVFIFLFRQPCSEKRWTAKKDPRNWARPALDNLFISVHESKELHQPFASHSCAITSQEVAILSNLKWLLFPAPRAAWSSYPRRLHCPSLYDKERDLVIKSTGKKR